MYNILVVDDEKEIADLIAIYLQNENYHVYKYYDSTTVIKDLDNMVIDLAILDIMMPKIDGLSLCKMIRQKYNFPIIFVTAKGEDIDKISGLTIGADDYVTKPFEPLELMARVKAQIRRNLKYSGQNNDSIIEFRGITINKNTYECYLNKQKLDLTKTEFGILWLLCQKRGSVVKNDELFRTIWGEKYFEKDNNTIMVHIRHLRQKMHDSGKNPKYIKTRWGVGYQIEDEK